RIVTPWTRPRVITRQGHGDADGCRAHPHGARWAPWPPFGWEFVVVVILLILLFYERVYGARNRSRQTGHRSGRRTARDAGREQESGSRPLTMKRPPK